MAPNDFLALTPCEFHHISKAFSAHEAEWFNNMGAVAYQSVGAAFAGKKYRNLFAPPADEGEENGVGFQKSTLEDRNNTIDYFKNLGKVRREVK